MGEEGCEARAEVDVPTPEAAQCRFGIFVVMCAELAVLAGVILVLSLSFNCFLIKGLALLLSYSITQQPGIILQTIIQITNE